MAAQRWTQAVRQQVGLGRLLPLGEARDGAWIAESAATEVLRRTVVVAGVRLGALRLSLADPEDVAEPVVPLPPSALPPGPLKVTAGFAATLVEPLPETASRVRAALRETAGERLGLLVSEVDLEVSDLFEDVLETGDAPAPVVPEGRAEERAEAPAEARESAEAVASGSAGGPGSGSAGATGPGSAAGSDSAAGSGSAGGGGDSAEGRVAAAVLRVPGVTGLAGVLGGLGRPVHIQEVVRGAALPRRHVRVEVAVSGERRTLSVTRAVREAAADALEDRPTVAVLVTTVT